MVHAFENKKRNPCFHAGILYGLLPLVLGSLSLLLPSRARWNPPGIEEGYVEFAAVMSWEKELRWLDARSRMEFEDGTIPGALWMDATDFESQLMVLMEHWEPGMEIVVFCGSEGCDASQLVAERLRNEVGLPSVWVLLGGWEAWKRANR